MVSAAVILRRQWMERERLAYPLTQVGVALVAGEEREGLINGLFRKRAFWYGAAIPLIIGSLTALHRYHPSVPTISLYWTMPFFGQQRLQLSIFDRAVRNLEPAGIYWQGLGFFAAGGVVMLLLTWARQRLLWWPFHPVGFPIGAIC